MFLANATGTFVSALAGMPGLTIWLAATLAGCSSNQPLPTGHRPIALNSVPLQYDDDVQSSFKVSEAHWQEIVLMFRDAADGPSERIAIADAVSRFERIAGEQTPVHRDQRKNQGAGPGKTDCLDESQNTTVFLRLLREREVLKHHRVMNKALRSPLNLDIHWTAVVQDIASEERWVIDSWYNANGEQPIVQPLKDWLKKKPVPGYYADEHQ